MAGVVSTELVVTPHLILILFSVLVFYSNNIIAINALTRFRSYRPLVVMASSSSSCLGTFHFSQAILPHKGRHHQSKTS